MHCRVSRVPARVVESVRAQEAPGEALAGWSKTADFESIKYNCDATITILFPTKTVMSRRRWKEWFETERGLGVACISGHLAARLGAHFEERRLSSFSFSGMLPLSVTPIDVSYR